MNNFRMNAKAVLLCQNPGPEARADQLEIRGVNHTKSLPSIYEVEVSKNDPRPDGPAVG